MYPTLLPGLVTSSTGQSMADRTYLEYFPLAHPRRRRRHRGGTME